MGWMGLRSVPTTSASGCSSAKSIAQIPYETKSARIALIILQSGPTSPCAKVQSTHYPLLGQLSSK